MAPIPENTGQPGASCTTSSAWARLPMIEVARPVSDPWKRLDQNPKRLLITAAQSGEEFRLVELGLTHEGCPGALALLPTGSDGVSVTHCLVPSLDHLHHLARGAVERADLPRNERTRDRLSGARRAAPEPSRHEVAFVPLRGMSALLRPDTANGAAARQRLPKTSRQRYRGSCAGRGTRRAPARVVRSVHRPQAGDATPSGMQPNIRASVACRDSASARKHSLRLGIAAVQPRGRLT